MALVNFNFFVNENGQQVPYSEVMHRFNNSLLIEVLNPHSLDGKVTSPIFFLQGYQGIVELGLLKASKCKTRLTVKLLRPFDHVESCVIDEMVTICVSQRDGLKFYRINDEYVIENKKSKKAPDEPIILNVEVNENDPVAMIYRSEYALNKLSFRKPVSNLNESYIWFLNEHLADVWFTSSHVKNGSIMKHPGHRMILSSLSDAITKLLQESLANGTNEIDFTNYSCDAVNSLLRFLYTGQLIIAQDHLPETLEILNTYASNHWPVLMKQLVKLITTRTVLIVYEFALAKSSSNVYLIQLKEFCLNFIDVNADVILTDQSLLKITNDTLLTILQRDTLYTREHRLFTALDNWSKSKCIADSLTVTPENQLSYIRNGLKFIRFNAMSASEFASGPAASGLVTNEDTIKFLMNVANRIDDTRDIIMFGKPRNQQKGWTNGQLDIRAISLTESEPCKITNASAPKCNQLDQLACSCDDNIETKLQILYPNLKVNN